MKILVLVLTGYIGRKLAMRFEIESMQQEISTDKDAVDMLKTEFEDLIREYTKDQIFNADETGLNFKIPKVSCCKN